MVGPGDATETGLGRRRPRSGAAQEDDDALPGRRGTEDPAGAGWVGEGADTRVARPLVSGNSTLILFLRPFSPRSTLVTGGFVTISPEPIAHELLDAPVGAVEPTPGGRSMVRGVAKATDSKVPLCFRETGRAPPVAR